MRTKLTATEFMQARVYCQVEDKRQREEDWKELHREDWYLARIAYEVYLLNHTVRYLFSKKVPKPELTVNDFLLHRPLADKKEKKAKKKRLSPEEQRLAVIAAGEAAKQRWAASLGMTLPPPPKQ